MYVPDESGGGQSFFALRSGIEQAGDAHDDQDGAGYLHGGRRTDGRMHRRGVDRLFGSLGIALDDNVLVEIAVRVQRIRQTSEDQQDAEQAETGKSQQRQDQHGKQPDQEDRQQRQQQQCLRLSSHRTINQDSNQ